MDAKTVNKDNRDDLNGFLDSLDLATKIHKRHVSLKNSGHPLYQVNSISSYYYFFFLKQEQTERGNADIINWTAGCKKIACFV